MKKILISIKPVWVAKILNGEKTIEVRKTAPKCELPVEVYIYCTKDNKRVWYFDKQRYGCYSINAAYEYVMGLKPLNGKVVAKFTLKKVEETKPFSYMEMLENGLTEKQKEIADKTCIGLWVINEYANGKSVYLWHISDLEIFDKPKELDEFDYPCPSGTVYVSKRSINGLPSKKHPPQSWCYVEERK